MIVVVVVVVRSVFQPRGVTREGGGGIKTCGISTPRLKEGLAWPRAIAWRVSLSGC